GTLLTQGIAIFDRHALLTRLAVDRKQRVHEHDHALRVGIGDLRRCSDLNCFDEFSPRVSHAARMDHALGANVIAISGVSVCLKYPAKLFEKLSWHLATACHLEVEDHASC